MKKRIKINGAIIVLGIGLIAAFPGAFLRHRASGLLESGVVGLGLVMVLLGQLIRVSARGFKSEHSANGHALIQDGPYSLVRNPMYLGILMIGIGVVLALFRWWAACVFLLIFILRYITLITQEEERLRAAFPRDYPRYRQHAPLLFPDPRLLLRQKVDAYLPLKWSWLKKEIRSIAPILFAVLVVRSWLDISHRGWSLFWAEVALWSVILIFFTGFSFYLNKKTREREGQCLS